MEVVGKVLSIDRYDDIYKSKIIAITDDENHITINSTLFIPFLPGDSFSGRIKPIGDDIYSFITYPFVKISTEKQDILDAIIKACRSKSVVMSSAKTLYTVLLANATRLKKSIVEFISMLAIQNNGNVPFDKIHPTEHYRTEFITPKRFSMFLNYWHEKYMMRKLYLLGLTKSQIYECGEYINDPFYMIKIMNLCETNPYKLLPLDMAKCQSILKRQLIDDDIEENKCGNIMRYFWRELKNRRTATPIINVVMKFSYIQKYIKKLCEEYNLKTVSFQDTTYFYIGRINDIENEVANYIKRRLKVPKQNRSAIVPFHTTEDQIKAIEGALNDNICIINGPAGSGKSTVIKLLVENFITKKVNYIVSSFTGKAVSHIRDILDKVEGVEPTRIATFHRLLLSSEIEFTHLIIDEISMVTTELFHKFITKYNHNYQITFVGDSNQLEPISWGNLFNELLKVDGINTYTLHHNHRVGSGKSSIKNVCNLLISKTDNCIIEPSLGFFVNDGGLTNVASIAQALINGNKSFKIICPYNEDGKFCNEIIQNNRQDREMTMDSNGNKWYIDDHVIMTTNNYTINIMNGDEGRIVGFDKNTIHIQFRTKKVMFPKNCKVDTNIINKMFDADKDEEYDMGCISLAYAITVHRSQGSEWDYIILYIPSLKNESFLTRNMLYTSISRAKVAVWCFGTNIGDTLNHMANQETINPVEHLHTRINT